MTSFLRHFESLGDNCEFGFVLINNGVHDGGMFRWTMIRDFLPIGEAIDNGFENIYAFDNLTPCSPDMVRDNKTSIEFHTKMPIVADGGTFRFNAPKNELLSIYYFEREKCFYLVEKFFRTLKQASRIYVLKSTDQPLAQVTVDAILKSLRRHGDVSLLWICEADSAKPAGTVEMLGNNLYRGFISRFSKTLAIEDIDIPSWLSVCEKTLKLHTSIHGNFTEDADHQRPTQQPHELPTWFDAKLYLLANPDVAEAGMDAGEHYLQHGWKEGRLTRL
jgi:hypothetical protein